ncbi:MAG TPA: hypothetical protein PLC04_04360 [Candidatus Kapabacteria bacterium]|nr:hypothetical protein [Candidatus Kapabacteria bacterium]HOV92297.1 hypothetical protein [Candidatus Kapabacteria bacterium]
MKVFKIILLTFSLMVLILMTYGCSESSIYSNGENIVFPDSNVKFTAQVLPFLRYNCAYAGCHSGFSKAGGVVLDDYFEIMQYPGLIIPGNPDGSILVQILENRLPHLTYFYRGSITDNHIRGVRQWIKEGALLN